MASISADIIHSLSDNCSTSLLSLMNLTNENISHTYAIGYLDDRCADEIPNSSELFASN